MNFVHKVQRLIQYLGLRKCWAIPGKGILRLARVIDVSSLDLRQAAGRGGIPVFLTDSPSELCH
jgi:hypothetical protein